MPLAALAFASGCIFAVWAVVMAPLIAAAVPEKRRAHRVLASSSRACSPPASSATRWAACCRYGCTASSTVLLCAAAFSGLAILPALRLKELPARRPLATRVYPRSRFLALYLVPFAVWHLATGTFNPFNNVYFKRLGFADAQIGSIFAGRAVGAGGRAAAGAARSIRRFGLLNGIVVMMAATGVRLSALSAQPAGAAAVGAYVVYMAFQWMSEPGLNTLLMNHVAGAGAQRRFGVELHGGVRRAGAGGIRGEASWSAAWIGPGRWPQRRRWPWRRSRCFERLVPSLQQLAVIAFQRESPRPAFARRLRHRRAALGRDRPTGRSPRAPSRPRHRRE